MLSGRRTRQLSSLSACGRFIPVTIQKQIQKSHQTNVNSVRTYLYINDNGVLKLQFYYKVDSKSQKMTEQTQLDVQVWNSITYKDFSQSLKIADWKLFICETNPFRCN